MECPVCEQGVEGILAFPLVTITTLEKGDELPDVFVEDSNRFFSSNGAGSGLKPIISESIAAQFPLESEGHVEVDGWQWFRERFSYTPKTGEVFKYERRKPLGAYIAQPVTQLEQLVGKEVSGKDLKRLLESLPLGRNRIGKDHIPSGYMEIVENERGVATIVLTLNKRTEGHQSNYDRDRFIVLTIQYEGRLRTIDEIKEE